jgi:hypothetical protein
MNLVEFNEAINFMKKGGMAKPNTENTDWFGIDVRRTGGYNLFSYEDIKNTSGKIEFTCHKKVVFNLWWIDVLWQLKKGT